MGRYLLGLSWEKLEKVVGVQGFEPWTPCSQSRCATRLRYTPTEPIFYTDRAISSKSCNIQHMVAHFSSKLNMRIHAAFVALLMSFSLLATHWVGLSHSISHAGVTKQVSCNASNEVCTQTASHTSELCHLFDALTLASCIAPSTYLSSITSHTQAITPHRMIAQVDVPSQTGYQSQAPPPFIF